MSQDLCAEPLTKEIDEINIWMQRDLNAGVYKAGFAPDQETYDKNVIPVFAALNKLEARLAANKARPYILGDQMTELDVRAYATIIRFDTVYVQHFKCNLGTIRSNYPFVNNWLRHLYHNVPGFKESTDFKHIKENVSRSLKRSARYTADICVISIPRATLTSTRRRSHQWAPIPMWKKGSRTGRASKLVLFVYRKYLNTKRPCDRTYIPPYPCLCSTRFMTATPELLAALGRSSVLATSTASQSHPRIPTQAPSSPPHSPSPVPLLLLALVSS